MTEPETTASAGVNAPPMAAVPLDAPLLAPLLPPEGSDAELALQAASAKAAGTRTKAVEQ